jgi:hypothetical protein
MDPRKKFKISAEMATPNRKPVLRRLDWWTMFPPQFSLHILIPPELIVAGDIRPPWRFAEHLSQSQELRHHAHHCSESHFHGSAFSLFQSVAAGIRLLLHQRLAHEQLGNGVLSEGQLRPGSQ